MPAVNLLLQRVTHPQRKPYVRGTTFIDGEGPPPYGFFDETQDHLAGLYHGLLGWNYSIDAEDFTQNFTRAGYFGRRMLLSRKVNSVVGPAEFLMPLETLRYGTWLGECDNVVGNPFEIEAASAPVTLDGDFLLTARVVVIDLVSRDTVALRGFSVGTNPPSFPLGPGFAAGSDSPNWQILYAPDNISPAQFADTGIPILSRTPLFRTGGAWYTLQVSRVAGAVRWHINGQLCRLNGAEGLYYPYRILNGCRYIHAGRNHPGDPGAGFGIDTFNLLAQRSIA